MPSAVISGREVLLVLIVFKGNDSSSHITFVCAKSLSGETVVTSRLSVSFTGSRFDARVVIAMPDLSVSHTRFDPTLTDCLLATVISDDATVPSPACSLPTGKVAQLGFGSGTLVTNIVELLAVVTDEVDEAVVFTVIGLLPRAKELFLISDGLTCNGVFATWSTGLFTILVFGGNVVDNKTLCPSAVCAI